MFRQPDNKKIPDFEEDALNLWKSEGTFEESVNSRSSDNLYVFYDGPPFISGLPHYGHLLGSIAKDLIPRYWTMKGKRVERVWGWDAHGLTVENKVQKKLDIKSRKDIVSFGLEKFTEECYKYTSETSAEWNWYIDKIGRWVDIEHAYKTIDQSYMESVIWAFKELYDKGFIYEGVRTSLFCTTCGTPVSNFEVAMDNTYKDVEDPSVMVKFRITGTDSKFKDSLMLAWTTTPWTLPSNRGLVVDENELYVLVAQKDEKYIFAKKRLADVMGDTLYKVEQEFMGKDLVGLSYEPPYTFFSSNEHDFKVYSYEGMVHMEEGTGVVHSAPGFGMVDTDMGRHFGLKMMLTIDDEGKFIAGDNGVNPFEGMYYAKANKYIREDLNTRGLMYRDTRIVHRFPYHDRCDTLLIQKAQNSWFIGVNSLKSKLLDSNEFINWIPDHLKYGRFKSGIEQAPDWCISRSRFWATPMPVWEAADGTRIVIGSIKELEDLSGQKVKDLHRPYIDEITIKKDGKVYKRREEVLDSWFEAGSMPYAQLHYPFKNQDKFEKNYPGDYIVEYIAQTRAWFYVMHVLSNALFGTNSFKNVISTGILAGNDGRKMSKTYGNYTDPKDVLINIGGDALRLYLMNSALMLGGNANFDDSELKTKLNNVLNPLWNSMKFFITYANHNKWSPRSVEVSDDVLDVWIMTRLHETIRDLAVNIEAYQIPPAVSSLETFVDDLSRWYVRRSRDRISQGDNKALSTLYTLLITLSKAAAPVIPFMSENIYQHLVKEVDASALSSVHLTDYPEYDSTLIGSNAEIVTKMASTRAVVSLGLAIRAEKNLKVRQPLSTLVVESLGENTDEFYEHLVIDEVNVKKISTNPEDGVNFATVSDSNFTAYLDTELTGELINEGNSRELIRKIQDLRKQLGLAVSQKVEVQYENTPEFANAVTAFEKEIMLKVSASKLSPGDKFAILE